MFEYLGCCHCDEIQLSIEIPEHISQYSPRACDCDFCLQHTVEYLSHPEGKMHIRARGKLKALEQGSNQAAFLCCAQCGDVIAATLLIGDRRLGAVNACLLDEYPKMQMSKTVSPKLLEPAQKLARWQSVWFKLVVDDC